MKAGTLKHQIIIKYPTEVNTGGEIISTWVEFDTIRAEVLPKRGSEYWAAKQLIDEEPKIFHIRYLEGVTAKMRVYFNDIAYDIKHVQNVEMRNREMLLVTVKVEGQ
jgi:SPP1 family predicted phage head-tail adaptor